MTELNGPKTFYMNMNKELRLQYPAKEPKATSLTHAHKKEDKITIVENYEQVRDSIPEISFAFR